MKKIKTTTIILMIIILIYTIVSFVQLGDTKAPQTLKTFETGEISQLPMKEKTQVGRVKLYVGNNISDLKIYLVEENQEKLQVDYKLQYDSVFKWMEMPA